MQLVELAIGFFSIIFTIIIYILCFQKFTHQKYQINFKSVLSILIAAIIIMLNNIFVNSIIKTFICLLCFLIVCKISFNTSYKKSFYYTIIISIVSIFIEIIISRCLGIFFDESSQLSQALMAKTALTIMMSSLLYLVMSIKNFDVLINKFYTVLSKRVNYNLIFITLLLISNILLGQYSRNYNDNKFYIISIGIVLFILILIICLLKNMQRQEALKIKNKYLVDNIKNYETISDDYAELRHNLNADFLAIRSVANKKAQEIIDEKIQKYNKNYNWVTHIGDIPKGIQGVICIKLYEIKNTDINFEIKSDIDSEIINKMSPKIYSNLCDYLVILLNNAIEACNKSEEKIIFIEMEEENNKLCIKIINTFKDALDIDKLGDKKYSTKKIKSGIGLNYISRHNKSIQIKKEIINNLFIVSMQVPLLTK